MVSHYPAKFGGHHGNCVSADIMVLVCQRILQDIVIKGLGQGSFKEGHHPAKFGGHRNCGSGDIMVLLCHTILQDHVSKGSANVMGRSPLSKSASCQIWWPWAIQQWRYNGFSLLRHLARKRKQTFSYVVATSIVVVEICFQWLRSKI